MRIRIPVHEMVCLASGRLAGHRGATLKCAPLQDVGLPGVHCCKACRNINNFDAVQIGQQVSISTCSVLVLLANMPELWHRPLSVRQVDPASQTLHFTRPLSPYAFCTEVLKEGVAGHTPAMSLVLCD